MCGIAGVWRKRGPAGPGDMADIARMMEATLHRGPDDHGSWHSGRLALGHRRLSIIDVSRDARQPMLAAGGEGALVYNGEVYNFRALRDLLRKEGVEFRTDSDTEVVLQALRQWGPRRAVPLFNGMFSLGYYDARDSALWLARDRLGIKPMSVADAGDRVIFASEDKAIIACEGFPRDIDAREITLRLAWQSRDASSSLFGAIERLPPGGLWKITENGIDRGRFWHVLDVLDTDRITGEGASDGERIAGLETLMGDSVGLHCIADAPLATSCSGGVDSGLITALAKKFRPGIGGYVVDPRPGHSEAESAERTGRHVGVELRRVPLDQQRFFELWPKMAWHLESDGWHPSWMALLAMAEQCRADGIKVLLTGEGADELFGGYGWQQASAKKWRFATWPASLFRSKRALDRKIERGRHAPYAQSMGGASQRERNTVIRALAPELNLLQTEIFDRLEPVTPMTDRAFLGCCIYDLYSHLQDLLHRHDRLGMAASVELRVPFLENRLIDFAIHLPRRFKFCNGQSKWLLKQVAARHIPHQNLHAPKIGFGMPQSLSAGSQGLLRKGLLRDALKWPAASVEGMVGLAARDEESRMRLVGMELFLRLYAGGATPESLTEALSSASREAR